jgi:hypothetical protein
LQQGTEGQTISNEDSQIIRIEQPPKSNTFFHFPLSDVTDEIINNSILVW